ncbi:unnamed protein product [Durusdinium trenchii]|uniref:Uncharacterized protein n=1 Tax=Durusdinium trenchii TaxID=1381693 RepID=A0ABP0SA55_9DINO
MERPELEATPLPAAPCLPGQLMLLARPPGKESLDLIELLVPLEATLPLLRALRRTLDAVPEVGHGATWTQLFEGFGAGGSDLAGAGECKACGVDGEEPDKLRVGGGKGKHAAALLAQEVQLAGEAAEEARRNREARAAVVPAAKVAKAANQSGEFVGDKQVMVKDLLAASKALKMPLCSEFAAQNFHKKLLPRLGKARNEEQIRESLVEALADLDKEFLTKFRTDRSGCCAQLALLVGRKLYLVQLGSGGAMLSEGRAWNGAFQSDNRFSR